KKKKKFSIKIGKLTPTEQPISLRKGDTLILHRKAIVGQRAIYDDSGQIVQPAHVSCQAEEIFSSVTPGERMFFDDGNILTKVEQVSPDEIHAVVMRTKPNGGKLKAEKGINLPDTILKLEGLTEKDKQDLKFIVEHADIVNASFINTEKDVRQLFRTLADLNCPEDFGIILKIETYRGLINLPRIMLEAMQRKNIGVMLARGDLAVECGWENLAVIQEEVLRLCEAAHVPLVWATQVLEDLAKQGKPTRAEISDVSLASRAECIMLNKGPYIIKTIRVLDKVIQSMQKHRKKRSPMLPEFSDQYRFRVD
ncbi:MAG: pyruvate kinase, partial [Cytophagales bacterium]|nr:pyruvate kinase [Cytophagales bacterium]